MPASRTKKSYDAGLKNRTCRICKEILSCSSDIPRHLKGHYKDCKYKCPFPGCGFGGKQKNNVNVHYRTHFDARPERCPDCDFRTKDPGCLTRHRKRYHDYVPQPRQRKFLSDDVTKNKASSKQREKVSRSHAENEEEEDSPVVKPEEKEMELILKDHPPLHFQPQPQSRVPASAQAFASPSLSSYPRQRQFNPSASAYNSASHWNFNFSFPSFSSSGRPSAPLMNANNMNLSLPCSMPLTASNTTNVQQWNLLDPLMTYPAYHAGLSLGYSDYDRINAGSGGMGFVGLGRPNVPDQRWSSSQPQELVPHNFFSDNFDNGNNLYPSSASGSGFQSAMPSSISSTYSNEGSTSYTNASSTRNSTSDHNSYISHNAGPSNSYADVPFSAGTSAMNYDYTSYIAGPSSSGDLAGNTQSAWQYNVGLGSNSNFNPVWGAEVSCDLDTLSAMPGSVTDLVGPSSMELPTWNSNCSGTRDF
ncbi:hypothetical protein VKT23_013112 [Stygiomarasmius scandens]|uniref:C2H2-type domain-containing protein n=1 Tax=Marasmiellus scandens TaxID=2682957 RepID=A0ABR1J8A0_9AGAR